MDQKFPDRIFLMGKHTLCHVKEEMSLAHSLFITRCGRPAPGDGNFSHSSKEGMSGMAIPDNPGSNVNLWFSSAEEFTEHFNMESQTDLGWKGP